MVQPVSQSQELLGGLIALDLSWLDMDSFLTAAQHANSNVTSEGLLDELRNRSLIDGQDQQVLRYLAARELREKNLGECLELRKLPQAALQLVGELSDRDQETAGDRPTTDVHAPITASSVGPDRTVDFPTAGAAAPLDLTVNKDGRQRFTTLRPHARGGLGEVSVAWDEELGREVAFKQMQPQFVADADSRRRFQFEAALTGRLEHPGIVPVYGAGEDQATGPYYAMRFIKGNSLAGAIQRYHTDRTNQPDDARELRRLVGYLINACNTIEYAHSREVIHRDIKPANMMIGDFGETFVVDWGLAKYLGKDDPTSGGHLSSTAIDEHLHTQPGSIAGTLAYMSPEQARGDLKTLGPSSDVYSLGASLYCLLTGHAAFRAVDAEGDRGELLRRVRNGDFPSPRSLRADVSPALDAICMKAMAPIPARRYATAEAFKHDLENWLAGEPVTAWREPWTERVRRWVNRNRTFVVATSVAIVIATLGLAGVVAVQSKSNRELANSNASLRVARDLASDRTDLALAAIEKIPDIVIENLDVQNHPDLASVRHELLKAPQAFYQAFQQQVADSDDTSPETRLRLAAVYENLGEISNYTSSQEAAIESYQAGIHVVEGLLASDASRSEYLGLAARLHFQLANCFVEHPDLGDAQSELGQAAALRMQMQELEPDNLAVRLELGRIAKTTCRIHRLATRLDQALEAIHLAKSHFQYVAEAKPDDVEVLFELAAASDLESQLLNDLGHLSEAYKVIADAINMTETVVALPSATMKQGHSFSRMLISSGQLQLRLGNLGESRDDTARSLIMLRRLTTENPANQQLQEDLAAVLTVLARIDFETGSIQRAVDATHEAVGLLEAMVVLNPTNVAYRRSELSARMGLASRLYMVGRKTEAIAAYREIVPRYEALSETLPDDYRIKRGVAGTYYNLGVLLSETGSHDETLDAYEHALRLRRELVADHPEITMLRNDVAFTLGNNSNVLERRGDLEAAIQHSSEVIAIQRQVAAESPESVEFLSSLGRSLASHGVLLGQLGRPNEARAHFDEALTILTQLVTEAPQRTQSRRDLIVCHRHLANLQMKLGEEASARKSYETSCQLVDSLVAESPEEVASRFLQSVCYSHFAEALLRLGDFAAAVETAEQVRGTTESLLADNPQDAQFQDTHVASLRCLAKAQAGAGNRAAAEQAADTWLAARPEDDSQQADLKLRRAWLELWSGDVAAAASEVETVLAAHHEAAVRSTAAQILAHAVQHDRVVPDQVQTYGQRAVGLLKELNQAGELTSAHRLEFRFGHIYEGLRQRDDFPLEEPSQ